ncbi:hypothetical protein KY336_02505 [Candidatus Woesearchaeota archaeon]|nr:hypothetical protein [Candidatus Woesearchaeota archaeon]
MRIVNVKIIASSVPAIAMLVGGAGFLLHVQGWYYFFGAGAALQTLWLLLRV